MMTLTGVEYKNFLIQFMKERGYWIGGVAPIYSQTSLAPEELEYNIHSRKFTTWQETVEWTKVQIDDYLDTI